METRATDSNAVTTRHMTSSTTIDKTFDSGHHRKYLPGFHSVNPVRGSHLHANPDVYDMKADDHRSAIRLKPPSSLSLLISLL